jgi:hypothetical protein
MRHCVTKTAAWMLDSTVQKSGILSDNRAPRSVPHHPMVLSLGVGLVVVALAGFSPNYAHAAAPSRTVTRATMPTSPPTTAARPVRSQKSALVPRTSVWDEPSHDESLLARPIPDLHGHAVLPESIPPGWEDERFVEDPGLGWHGDAGAFAGPHVLSGLCWDTWEGFAGVQGFAGPANRGSTGSFGFHQGINWGTALPLLFGDAVAGQLGVRAVQSNFQGAEFTADERRQVFVTGGLFRRVDWGLQGGAVIDYLHESWYFQGDFLQIRGELSWVYPEHHELGFWLSANRQTQEVISTIRAGTTQRQLTESYEGTDLYAFFYRYRADACGGLTGRLFAGFTGHSAGLLGSDCTLPLNHSWAVQTSFLYLIPQGGRTEGGVREEAWNVGMSLVWRPGGGFVQASYFRPLFQVADNGVLITRRP